MTRYKAPADPQALAPFRLELSDLSAPVDWRELFGRAGPVEIEIGSGKGLFLINAGQQHPDHNFLGIEISSKYARICVARVAKRNLGNVRVMQTDARYFLQTFVPDESVRAVHVYFPDPWWKKRHQKRRVFTAEMVSTCQRVLEPGGCVHIATDVPAYREDIVALFKLHTRLVQIAEPPAAEPTHDMDYLTNFDRKFRQGGREIHRFGYRKP